MVSFNQIPNNLRVPLFYAEFDNSRAVQGVVTQDYKVLLIGPRLSTGTIAALTPKVVTSAEQAQGYFGAGSVLADMIDYFLRNTRNIQITAVALDDLLAGVAATGTVTISGTPTASGVASFMIGGRNYKVNVSTSSTPTSLASALSAAIMADSLRLVNSSPSAGVVTLTARNKGEQGNEIDTRDSYFDGEALPAGIAVAYSGMSSGAGNPDVSTVFPVLDETQYILMQTPFLDAANLTAMETELADRFGPIRQNDGYAFYAKRASLGNLITLGNSRNSQFTTIMGMSGPSNPWAFASAALGQIAFAASNDPARPFQTLPMVGIYAPNMAESLTVEERNQLLYAGIATFYVAPGSVVSVEGVVTTYKQNAFGSPDTSYLYLNTPLTLSIIRFDLKARITQRFPRHKLANDGTRFAPGQAIVTPGTIKAEVVSKFRDWEELGWVENFEQFKEDLIVERNANNPNRVDILMPPDLVNQLIIVGAKIQFLL